MANGIRNQLRDSSISAIHNQEFSAASLAISPDMQRTAIMCACVVAFAYSSNYTNHAPLAPALAREFGFSQTLAGLLTTGIFATHATMQIPGGHLVDRFGARRVLLVALLWVAFGNFGIALATAYWQLLACKIFTGVGTGVCFVGGARFTHQVGAGSRLGVAQGLFGGSVQLGAGFVILAVPRIYLWAGWRPAFIICACMALTAAFIWLAGAPNLPPSPAAPGRWREMLLSSQLWLLGLVQMGSFGLSVVIGSWIVTVLTKAMGVPATRAGLIGSLVLLLGILTRPLGGMLRREFDIRSIFTGALLLNAVGCFALAATSISLGIAVGAVVLLGLGCGLPYAAMFTRAGQLFPGRAGAAMGLVNMLGIVMILAGAPLVGNLADLTGTFRASFLFLGGFSLLICAIVPLIHRDDATASLSR
jgi:nitrate/nitrite transporter NarK